jgi:mono/diheme cytochrome c family protein
MKVTSLTRSSLLAIAAACLVPLAQAATPAEMLAGYTAKAGEPASPERGQKLYATNFGREMGWSCASCHGSNPARDGRDQMTEKRLAALAPAANPTRFTEASKTEHFFRLNCKDVVGRECSAGEKADVLAWLLTLKP